MFIKSNLPVYLLAIVFLAGCDSISPFEDENVEGPYIQIDGTIQYMELEGGFWSIESQDEIYIPRNLPERFQKEGLAVSVRGKIEKDVATIYMAGPVITIQKIEKR